MAANTFHFTKKAIDELPAPATGRVYYADTETPGLWLRVTSRKVFLFQRKLSGRKVRVTIGPYPAVLPEQARQEVIKMQAAAVKGEDPGAARRQARESHTFGALFARYLEGYAAEHHKDKGREAARKGRIYFAPRLANRRWEEITTPFLRKLQGAWKREHGATMANRLVEVVRGVWNWGIRQEEPGVPVVNRAAKLEAYPETERARFLNGEELRALFQALDAEAPTWRDFFLLALLTGARRGNVQAMRWQDIDLEAGVWTVPGEFSKNGEPLQIVLAPEAAAILRGRLAEARKRKVLYMYVFPPLQAGTKRGTKRVGHLCETRAAWLRVCEAARKANPDNPELLKDVKLHDLRRTLASWQAAGGSSLAIIGKSLGHKSLTATAIYARLDLDPVRTSVEKAAAAMLAAGRGKAGGE
jgi:integrase